MEIFAFSQQTEAVIALIVVAGMFLAFLRESFPAEGVALAKAVDRSSIRVLADLYHMQEDAEPTDTVVEHAAWLTHIHVADSGRLAPGTGSYPYAAFFGYLKSTGYRGRIAVECKWQDFEAEAGLAVEYLHKVWDAARGDGQ